MDRARSKRLARSGVASGRPAGGQNDGLTADLIDALRGVTERLGRLEDARDRPPPLAAADAKPTGLGDAGPSIDDDLLAALRSRRDAFADVVAADRGGKPGGAEDR